MVASVFSLFLASAALVHAGALNVQDEARFWASDSIWADGAPALHTPTYPSFSPVGSLSALGSDAYTTLTHPVFPAHSVRIKQSDFCDTTVKCVTAVLLLTGKVLI